MEVLSALAIPAVVKFFELVNKKDWKSVGKILLSIATGIAAGFLGIMNATPETGLIAGLAASGLVTVAGYSGEKAAKVVTATEAAAPLERKF